MDALTIARLQFATTTRSLPVRAATPGLVTLVAVMQTRAAIGGKPELLRMTKFWGRLVCDQLCTRIVTGIVMEFSFGLTWTGLFHIRRGRLRAPLAIETLVAFFAESTVPGLVDLLARAD